MHGIKGFDTLGQKNVVQENLLKDVMTCFVSEAFLSVVVYYYVTVLNIWDINGV